jgi:hypothetical protein
MMANDITHNALLREAHFHVTERGKTGLEVLRRVPMRFMS